MTPKDAPVVAKAICPKVMGRCWVEKKNFHEMSRIKALFILKNVFLNTIYILNIHIAHIVVCQFNTHPFFFGDKIPISFR